MRNYARFMFLFFIMPSLSFVVVCCLVLAVHGRKGNPSILIEENLRKKVSNAALNIDQDIEEILSRRQYDRPHRPHESEIMASDVDEFTPDLDKIREYNRQKNWEKSFGEDHDWMEEERKLLRKGGTLDL